MHASKWVQTCGGMSHATTYSAQDNFAMGGTIKTRNKLAKLYQVHIRVPL